MSNSHAQHGVVVPAWDTVAEGNIEALNGMPPQGATVLLQKVPKYNHQWSRAA